LSVARNGDGVVAVGGDVRQTIPGYGRPDKGGRGGDSAWPYFGGRRNGVARKGADRTGPAAGGRDQTGLEQFHRNTDSFAERGGRAPRTRPPEEVEDRHFPSFMEQKSSLAQDRNS